MRPSIALLGLAACGPHPVPPGTVPPDLPIDGVTHLNAWLIGRSGPADALGRFVSPAATAIDGSTGNRTACSDWFETVDLENPSQLPPLWAATPDAAAAVGVHSDGTATVYTAFSPSHRRGSLIKDPRGLRECCERSPDACTPTYIGEVWEGSGKIYRLDRSGPTPEWYKAGAIGGPYGIRLSGNPYSGPECGAWRDAPPRASKGTFLLGVSTATSQEQNARTDALRQARTAALAWLKENKKGDSLLAKMTEERWCVEEFPGETGGMDHLAQVLVYLPEE